MFGNEKVEELARARVDTIFCNPAPAVGLTKSEISGQFLAKRFPVGSAKPQKFSFDELSAFKTA